MIQKLNQFLARLQKIAEEFNVAVLMTNQVQSDPGVSVSIASWEIERMADGIGVSDVRPCIWSERSNTAESR